MNAPALQPLPVSAPSHWTDPVSREETVARRDKFRKVGWRPPNHKPKTKKVVTYAKNVWERYVTRCGSTFPYVLSRCERLTGVFLDIVTISVSMPINTYQKAAPASSKPGLTGYTVRPRRSRMKPSVNIEMALSSVLARQPMDNFTKQQVRRVRLVPFLDLE